MIGRVLAVDPGEKRIGLAISDLSGTIANPLRVIAHVNRTADALEIMKVAVEQEAILIVVGQPCDSEGEIGPAARKSARLAEEISQVCEIEVVLWDESGSTKTAQETRRHMGVSKKKRSGHLDDLAAVIILQSYLDWKAAV